MSGSWFIVSLKPSSPGGVARCTWQSIRPGITNLPSRLIMVNSSPCVHERTSSPGEGHCESFESRCIFPFSRSIVQCWYTLPSFTSMILASTRRYLFLGFAVHGFDAWDWDILLCQVAGGGWGGWAKEEAERETAATELSTRNPSIAPSQNPAAKNQHHVDYTWSPQSLDCKLTCRIRANYNSPACTLWC